MVDEQHAMLLGDGAAVDWLALVNLLLAVEVEAERDVTQWPGTAQSR